MVGSSPSRSGGHPKSTRSALRWTGCSTMGPMLPMIDSSRRGRTRRSAVAGLDTAHPRSTDWPRVGVRPVRSEVVAGVMACRADTGA
jgi:hypothetical protein